MVGRQHGEARALEPHLDVAGDFGGDVAQPEEHRPRGGDHDARGAGADARHALASDLARDPHAIALGRDLRRRHLERGGAVREEGVRASPCSKTMSRVVSSAPGASTVTSSGVVTPTNRSGWTISIAGPGSRPAYQYATPPPAARRIATTTRIETSLRIGRDDTRRARRLAWRFRKRSGMRAGHEPLRKSLIVIALAYICIFPQICYCLPHERTDQRRPTTAGQSCESTFARSSSERSAIPTASPWSPASPPRTDP